MKVRAKGFGINQCGYYGHIRRYDGDVFEIEDEPKRPADLTIRDEKTGEEKPHPLAGLPVSFSSRWMEIVESSTPITDPSSVKTRAPSRDGRGRGRAAQSVI